ncbi:unnamed protein product [Rhizophagus irregularis]|uniref:Tim10-like domain-containing protein n=1 Tax=Rhizophagus irregularis TaxID=588596 RepID=A0A916E9E9_9GLOM|nr:unnamed protein product [Rhizophagus irregularis]CAB4422999.1 unnamed protein product [Rhizophagus irregularis]CAB4423242.1 unnamed protein product [Rhizophagus irregularis]CAB4493857.1 unnamed protein product [Rhizophagus irregularis]CAB5216580.1 unnamed protein product [Rhizophagus irregularis]
MSFLPFGGGGSSQQTINQQNVAILEQEYEAVTETFNRIVDSCFKKCIPPKYIEALTKKGQEAGARTGGFSV